MKFSCLPLLLTFFISCKKLHEPVGGNTKMSPVITHRLDSFATANQLSWKEFPDLYLPLTSYILFNNENKAESHFNTCKVSRQYIHTLLDTVFNDKYKNQLKFYYSGVMAGYYNDMCLTLFSEIP